MINSRINDRARSPKYDVKKFPAYTPTTPQIIDPIKLYIMYRFVWTPRTAANNDGVERTKGMSLPKIAMSAKCLSKSSHDF